MQKLLKYLEGHPIIRIIVILSAILTVILSLPVIYNWCFTLIKVQTFKEILASDKAPKEYFNLSHSVCLEDSVFVLVRNRPLSDLERNEINMQTSEGKLIDSRTIIAQIENCTKINLLENIPPFLKIQYWDGVKVVVGYIPSSVKLELLLPLSNNPYGLGNGQITIYTTNEDGISEVYDNEKYIGSLNWHFPEYSNLSCNQRQGVLVIFVKGGVHLIQGRKQKGELYSLLINLDDSECKIINFTII